MSQVRRKALIRIAERVAVGLVLLDLALYFAVVLPLDHLATEEWRRLNSARHHVQEMQAAVNRMEKTRAALPETNEQLGSFLRNHIPSRRQGFSRAFRLVQQLTDKSGVQLADLNYRLEPHEGEPLGRLGMEVGVAGPFKSLLKFVHALETAKEFALVRGFTFTAVEGGGLELHMSAELYISP